MLRAFVCAAAVASVALSSRVEAAEEPEHGRAAWVLGSASFGFGGHRLGALYAAAAGEAHVWPIDDIGLGARYSGIAAGAPDGGGAEGSSISGIVSYRHAFGTIEGVEHTQRWFMGSLGVGFMHLSGYEGRMRGRDDFDSRALLLTPRLAFMQSWRFLAFGEAIEAAISPGQGVAGSVSLLAGAIF
jgi:hypothetical protein